MEEYNGSGRVPWKSAMEMKHSSGQSAVHNLTGGKLGLQWLATILLMVLLTFLYTANRVYFSHCLVI